MLILLVTSEIFKSIFFPLDFLDMITLTIKGRKVAYLLQSMRIHKW